MTRSFDVFFGLCPNERLSKQSWGCWFERPLWRYSKEQAQWWSSFGPVYLGTEDGSWRFITLRRRDESGTLVTCWNNKSHHRPPRCNHWKSQCGKRNCASIHKMNTLRTVKSHYNDVITSTVASQITSLTIVYSTVYSGRDQRKHQSSASLAFVRWFHRSPVNSPHKGPVTRKMFPFDDVIMSRIKADRYNLTINPSMD